MCSPFRRQSRLPSHHSPPASGYFSPPQPRPQMETLAGIVSPGYASPPMPAVDSRFMPLLCCRGVPSSRARRPRWLYSAAVNHFPAALAAFFLETDAGRVKRKRRLRGLSDQVSSRKARNAEEAGSTFLWCGDLFQHAFSTLVFAVVFATVVYLSIFATWKWHNSGKGREGEVVLIVDIGNQRKQKIRSIAGGMERMGLGVGCPSCSAAAKETID